MYVAKSAFLAIQKQNTIGISKCTAVQKVAAIEAGRRNGRERADYAEKSFDC